MEAIITRLDSASHAQAPYDLLKRDGDTELNHALSLLSKEYQSSLDPRIWSNQTWMMARDWFVSLLENATFEKLDEFSVVSYRQGKMTIAIRFAVATTPEGEGNSHYVRVQTGFVQQEEKGTVSFSRDRLHWETVDFEEDKVQVYFKEVPEL